MSSKIRINAVFSGLLVVSQLFFPLITFPYVSRVLGPSYLGNVSFIDSISQAIILIAALGIPIYGVRELAKVRDDKKSSQKLLIELVSIHLVSTIMLLVIYFTLYCFVDATQKHLMLIGMIPIVSQVFLIEWYYQGLEKFKYISIRSLAVRLSAIICIFVFVKRKEDFAIYFFINALVVLVNALVNFSTVFTFDMPAFNTIRIRHHLKPLAYILGSSLAVSVYLYLDNTFLGFLSTVKSVGYYSTAIKLNKIAVTLVTSLGIVLVSQLSKAFHQKNIQRLNELLQSFLCFVSILGSLLMFLLLVYGRPLVEVISGKQYLPAALPVMILSPIILAIGLSNLFGSLILTTLGFEKIFLKAVIFGMICSISLNLILIPYFQHVGAAITTLFTECLVAFLTIWYTFRYTQIRIKLGITLKYLITSGISVFTSYYILTYFDLKPLYMVLTGGCVAIMIYMLALTFMQDKFFLNNVKLIIQKIT